MGKLRIAMISEHGDPLAPLGGQQSGGQNVYVYELARFLSQLNIDVDVFTRKEDPKTLPIEKFAPNARVVRVICGGQKFLSKDKYGPLMPKFIQQCEKFCMLRKIQYDLIHAHYYYSGMAGIALSHKWQIPLVITFHSLGKVKKMAMLGDDSSPKDRERIEKEIMEKAHKIIAVSPDEKRAMIQHYQADRSKIIVIPPGVNLQRFKPVQKAVSRKRLGIKETKKVIVFAGKMEKRKGGGTLIEAISVIKKYHPKLYQNLAVYMFSGDPRKTNRLKEKDAKDFLLELINKFDVGDKVYYLLGVNQEELKKYYGAADVVVMPSYYEPFGMVATESMATVTPVVASSVGGLKWSIAEGLTGFHAKPKDPYDFARQIVKILKNEQLAENLGRNAFIRVRNFFNWFWISRQFLTIYSDLIYKNMQRQELQTLKRKILQRKIKQVLAWKNSGLSNPQVKFLFNKTPKEEA